MTWPVGKLEQLIKIRELQRRLEEVQSSRRSVVIHSYYEPVRAAWELAYQQQRSGTLPIPPGTKLCWYDMRSGRVKTYTTAWDRENGTATSGEVYTYSRNQNSDYFRFLGNWDVAGYLRGGENNSPTLHFGLNIGKRNRERLLMLEIYFAITSPTASVDNYIYLNYGNLVTQVDVTGVLYRQSEGGMEDTVPVVSSEANNSSTQTGAKRLAHYDPRPTDVSGFSAVPTFGRILVLNPFATRLSDGRNDGIGQTTVLGYLFSAHAGYNLVPRDEMQYRQFSSIRLTTLNMDQYYRIFPTTDNTGNDDNLVRQGHGWVYGYFDEAIGSLEEYE